MGRQSTGLLEQGEKPKTGATARHGETRDTAMKKVRRLLAATLLLPAAAVLVTSCAVLLSEWVQSVRTAERDRKTVEFLVQRVREDIRWQPVLEFEFERQKLISLERDLKYRRYGLAGLVSAAVVVTCVKLLLAGRREAPTPEQIRRHRGEDGARLVRRRWLFRRRPKRNGRNGQPATDSLDLSVVDRIVAEVGRGPDATIPILQRIQNHYRYLPEEALRRVCELTDITPAQIMGVATFYAQFRRTPIGRHLVKVCHGTACHVAGAREITEEIRRHLQIPEGTDTDSKRLFTVEEVACLGCCSLAPVIMIDDTTAGKLTPPKACEAIDVFLLERCG